MANSAGPDQFRSQLIWIYTVCKDTTYMGSAGLGLITVTVPVNARCQSCGVVYSQLARCRLQFSKKLTFNDVRWKKHVLTCAPTKTQISLRESSFFAWRICVSSAIQNASNEDSDQTKRMRRLIWILTGRTYPRYLLWHCSSINV